MYGFKEYIWVFIKKACTSIVEILLQSQTYFPNISLCISLYIILILCMIVITNSGFTFFAEKGGKNERKRRGY